MPFFRLTDPRTVAAHPRRDFVLLEARFSSVDHPPCDDRPLHARDAIRVHPSYFEAGTNRARYYPHYANPADGNLLDDRALTHAIERLGIGPDTPVVVYGREPDGTMAAARVIWALLYAGVRDVALLDGGFDAWLEAGGATVRSIPAACDANWNGRAVGRTTWLVRAHLRATTAEVRDAATPRATARLVDVRERGEWDGSDVDHYPFFSGAGHIPTALHQGDWSTLIDRRSNRIGPHVAAVADRWRDQGILDACVESGRKTLIFYCGTGWRSSIAFLVACLLGLSAKNYEDGFFGWSRDSGNVVVAARAAETVTPGLPLRSSANGSCSSRTFPRALRRAGPPA